MMFSVLAASRQATEGIVLLAIDEARDEDIEKASRLTPAPLHSETMRKRMISFMQLGRSAEFLLSFGSAELL